MERNEVPKLIEFLLTLTFFKQLAGLYAAANYKIQSSPELIRAFNDEFSIDNLTLDISTGFSILIVAKNFRQNVLIRPSLADSLPAQKPSAIAALMGPPDMILEKIDEINEQIKSFLSIKNALLMLGRLITVHLDEEIQKDIKVQNEALQIILSLEEVKKQCPINLDGVNITTSPFFSITNPELNRVLKININEASSLIFDIENLPPESPQLMSPPPPPRFPFSLN